MDPRYRETVVEEIIPRIEKKAAAALKRHGVTKEQYALWLYKRSYDRTGLQAAVVITLCVAILSALVGTLLQNGGVTLDGNTLVKFLTIGATLALTLSLTAWTMRRSSKVLEQHLTSARFLHRTSAEYIDSLSSSTLRMIANFEPDLDRFRMEKAVYRKPPALTIAQQHRIARLRPWRTAAGWLSLGALALLFFVGQGGMNIVTSLTITTVGAWLLVGSLQVYIAEQFEDTTTGLTTYGKPARAIASLEITFSLVMLLLGLYGVLYSSLL